MSLAVTTAPAAPTSHAEALKVPGALPKTPIFKAKKPYSLAFVDEARRYFNNFHMILGGDHAVYYVSHLTEFLSSAIAVPSGPVRDLVRELRQELGKTTFKTGSGKQSIPLDEYVGNGKQRVQAVMIVHAGKVVYESYPGIEPRRPHVWASVSKTMGG